jgi:hypothetical protein
MAGNQLDPPSQFHKPMASTLHAPTQHTNTSNVSPDAEGDVGDAGDDLEELLGEAGGGHPGLVVLEGDEVHLKLLEDMSHEGLAPQRQQLLLFAPVTRADAPTAEERLRHTRERGRERRDQRGEAREEREETREEREERPERRETWERESQVTMDQE